MSGEDFSGDKLLEVRDLRVAVDVRDRCLPIIKGVNLSLSPGETLGVVGESGAGKSVFGDLLLFLFCCWPAFVVLEAQEACEKLPRTGNKVIRGILDPCFITFTKPAASVRPALADR